MLTDKDQTRLVMSTYRTSDGVSALEKTSKRRGPRSEGVAVSNRAPWDGFPDGTVPEHSPADGDSLCEARSVPGGHHHQHSGLGVGAVI